MKKLSTGEDSTLGSYYKLCCAFFGKDSPSALYFAKKIEEQGETEEVIADEQQVMLVIAEMEQIGAMERKLKGK
jgi:hypothetical protein